MNFEKNTTIFIVDNFKDKPKSNFPKGNVKAYVTNSDTENAIAGAYIQYLYDQGIRLNNDDMLDIVEKIAKSLKRYKKTAKTKSISNQ